MANRSLSCIPAGIKKTACLITLSTVVLLVAFLTHSVMAQSTTTSIRSVFVSYQYPEDIQAEEYGHIGVESPFISYQFLDVVNSVLSSSGGIYSPFVSYQFPEWPGDSILSLRYSLPVSYYWLSDNISERGFVNSLNAIGVQPSQPTYGSIPTKESVKDNLIFITHGAIPPWEDSKISTDWVDEMSNSISTYLNANNLNTWQVVGYKWIDKAKFSINPASPQFSPQYSLNAAIGEGNIQGKKLKSEGWTHIHLIAHSAGAGMIQAITDVIKPSSTTVHCTFLDPFVGLLLEERTIYGNGADWSDQYYSHDAETGGYVGYKTTESLLNHAYNVDVTQLNKVRDYGAFVSSGGGINEPCYRVATYHGWAIDFYSNTITGNISFQYDGFGFPLSEEGGRWYYATNNYKRGNQIPNRLGTPDEDCISFASVDPQQVLKVAVSISSSVQSGEIELYENGMKATTHSPAWIDIAIYATNVMNYLSFDSQFLSAGAQGLLSFILDTNTIGLVDERTTRPGLQHYTFALPSTENDSFHMLGIRVDQFADMQSVVIVTNIVLGLIGPSRPFSLSSTTNKIDNQRVFILAGQPGYNYTVEASTNLTNWETVALLINTNGAVRFYDRDSTNISQRFYRATAP